MQLSVEGKIGILLTLVFGLGAGAAILWPDQRWIGRCVMAFSGFSLLALAYQHFVGSLAAGQSLVMVPPIGSLQHIISVMEIGHSQSTGNLSVQMYAELKNDNDYLIEYEAVVDGSVNGVTSPQGRIMVTGYVSANGTARLVYGRVSGIKYNDSTNFNPPVIGLLSYEVKYKPAHTQNYVRTTGRSLRFSQPFEVTPGSVGSARQIPMTVFTDHSFET